jgi:hypothetical protein
MRVIKYIISFLLLSCNFVYSAQEKQHDNMPLVISNRLPVAQFKAPIPQRGEEFREYLSVSVQIDADHAYGSGTIIYYDEKSNTAYVASCGHLWDGNMRYEESKSKNKNCQIIVWYHGDKKLEAPKKYKAKILFHRNERGYDISLITFKPDWKPDYFPIAPESYEIKSNSRYHSLGCDNGKEVAHYDIEIIDINKIDIVTRFNSPRPGRSGGGLLSTDGYYIGTCWGTSDYSGKGYGYFVPIEHVIEQYKKENLEWLVHVSRPSSARKIPIVDINNSQGQYLEEYIPLPEY